MENNETIGGKILSLRKAKGYTQADLGARLNISYQAVSKWERDESCPDFDTLSKIAQIFNVPITYFERGGEELATAQTAVASEQTREMLGVCKDCGKVVYEGNEGATTPALVCKDCMNARKLAVQRAQEVARQAQEKQRQEQYYKEQARKDAIARSRNKGLIWGGIVSVIWLVIGFVSGGDAILGGIILAVFGFFFTSQMFWDGAVFDCACAGGKVIGTPGVIFTFDLDGFIFLIAMKILFAVLKFFIFVLTAGVCVLAGVLISPFTFVPALLRVNREGV